MRVFLTFVFAIAALAFAGCTTPIKSNYARTHTLPPKGEAKTYAFDSEDSKVRGTLEYETYCNQIAAVLDAYGWRQIKTPGKDGAEKAGAEKPDYWVTLVYGYSLSKDLGNTTRAITAPSLTSNEASSINRFFANVEAYYTGISITTQPKGEGDAVFVAQVFGSSDTEMLWVIRAMIRQLMKDFPGEIVTTRDIVLHTRR